MAQLYYTPFVVQSGQISGTLTNWPALLDWTHTRFKSVSNGGHVNRTDGRDLIPYTSSALTTKLAFERESYDPATGHFIDWVKIPSAADATTIYYGYGDPTITTDQQNVAGTWDSNHILVAHMKDGTTLSLVDTMGLHSGTPTGSPTATAGKIDGGMSLNGVNNSQWVEWSTSQLLFNQANFTFSTWVNFADLSSENFIYSENYSAGVIFLVRSTTGAKLQFGIFDGGTFNFATSVAGFSVNTWYLIACTRRVDGLMTAVINGGPVASASSGYSGSTITSVKMGRIDNSTFEGHHNGKLDEVRCSNILRSFEWLGADFNCQDNQTTFWGSLATEVNLGGGPPAHETVQVIIIS